MASAHNQRGSREKVENRPKGLAANAGEGGLAGSMDNCLGLFVFDDAYSIPPAVFLNVARKGLELASLNRVRPNAVPGR